ncbi:unnamed protein product, partial [Thlaspi arvense]
RKRKREREKKANQSRNSERSRNPSRRERERESYVEEGGDEVIWREETDIEEDEPVLHEDGDEERTMDESHIYMIMLILLCDVRWSLIAGRIPGRTDNEIKNYWNTHLRKKLLRQGIDPQTHKPLDANNTHKPGEEVSGGQNLLEPDTTVSSGNGASKISTSIFGDEDEEDFGFCYDDKFSSFLNSLINDDPFDSNIPIPQPLLTHNCTDEIVGTSSSARNDQRPEDM